MTKKNAEFIPIKEAATLLNKSVRTVKRYLGKVDNRDKNRMSKLSNGRVFVSLEFVKLVQNGELPKNTILESNSPSEYTDSSKKDKRIESLESQNKELFEIIKKKDDLLIQKDELIKSNLEDFKTLTSKVLYLQDENIKLQIPKNGDAEELQNTSKVSTEKDGVLLFLFVGMLFLLILVGFLVFR